MSTRARIFAAVLVAGSFGAAAWLIASSRSPDPSPPSDNPDAPAAAPAEFVGLSEAGDIVVASVEDGKRVRVLVGRAVARGETSRLRTLRLSPDRKTLYFVIHQDDDCSEVASVPVAGGPIQMIAKGDSPTLNPAGTRLAYTQLVNCGGFDRRVVVRDLATGREGFWAEKVDPDGVVGMSSNITWSGNDGSIVVWRCGADSCGPSLLSVEKPGSDLWQSSRPLPSPTEPDAFWGCVGVRGRRGTLVARADYSSVTGNEKHPIDEIDPSTGKVRRLIPNGRLLGCLTFEASGDEALFVRDGAVGRWNARGGDIIARGYTEAVW